MQSSIDDYKQETIRQIRIFADEKLTRLSNEQIADLYRSWSNLYFSASWLTPNDYAVYDFVHWATTAPCDNYEV